MDSNLRVFSETVHDEWLLQLHFRKMGRIIVGGDAEIGASVDKLVDAASLDDAGDEVFSSSAPESRSDPRKRRGVVQIDRRLLLRRWKREGADGRRKSRRLLLTRRRDARRRRRRRKSDGRRLRSRIITDGQVLVEGRRKRRR